MARETDSSPTKSQHSADEDGSKPDTVGIIGAGSSGIVALKVLRQHGVEAVCYEKGSGVGGNWRFRNDNGMSAAYASLHINTSKERMAYSDFPMPEHFPDYPHHAQVLEYFESYVDHFELRDEIRFNTSVEQAEPTADGRWRLRLSTGEEVEHRALLVANGHHWSPRQPSFRGQLTARSMHSHDYETAAGFEGKRCLIIGIGNSGVDIACELSRIADKVWLSTRRSAHILPKYAFGKPIDQYTTPASSRLPGKLQELGFKVILGLARGPQTRFGVPQPEHSLLQAHPTVSSDLLNLVGHGRIKIKPDIDHFDGNDTIFVDDTRETVDAVIFATGYKIDFPFFDNGLIDTSHNRVDLYRHVVHPELANLYFVGLIQPLGAVMPLAEAQSQWVAKLVTGAATLPGPATIRQGIEADRERMAKRYVTSDRHTIQVDFYPYMRQIEAECA